MSGIEKMKTAMTNCAIPKQLTGINFPNHSGSSIATAAGTFYSSRTEVNQSPCRAATPGLVLRKFGGSLPPPMLPHRWFF